VGGVIIKLHFSRDSATNSSACFIQSVTYVSKAQISFVQRKLAKWNLSVKLKISGSYVSGELGSDCATGPYFYIYRELVN